jgi:acetyl esterase
MKKPSRATRLAAACLATACLGASYAFAATTDTPEARAYIEKFGGDFPFDRDQEIIGLYSRIIARTQHDDSGLKIVRDQHYGPDERNRLDVHYQQDTAPGAKPVVIFFHGGGFVSGDKVTSPQIYDNVANYFARHGLVAINATYRLAPQHKWPSGVEDVRDALAWAHTHVAAHGGNPNQIYLLGQSAGASHVASYVFSDYNDGHDGLAGAVLMSGVYSGPVSEDDSGYYGADKNLRVKQSTLAQINLGRHVPVFLMYAQYDPLWLAEPTLDLARKLCDRDRHCPPLIVLDGHNHLSMIFHFDTADESGAREIVTFIRNQSAHISTAWH